MTDIDIDFFNRDDILSIIPHVTAVLKNGRKHNTGIYCHQIPINPLTGLSSLDYETAEERGYFKIDFLNVSAYDGIRSEEHISQLLEIEPLWELLHEKEICDKLFHINGYHNLLKELNPTSIDELAMVLALIRPGKRHLTPKCKSLGFDSIKDEIWEKTDDSYYFKRSHGLAYAHVIVLQLNYICEEIK
jgi:DNA polymerase III alpha subunit